MDNYSAYCENLDLNKLLIEKDGEVELTEEAVQKAEAYSEGNKYLYDVLTSCWKHKVKTTACCAGHEGPINDDNTNLFPYLSIVLDDNSLPYIKSIIGQLQKMKDVEMTAGFTLSEENWGPDVPERYKTFQVYCCLPNRCEVFYKIHKAIEECREKIDLSSVDKSGTSAEEFFNMVTNFQNKQFNDEEKVAIPRIAYGFWPQELVELQIAKTKWQKFKEKARNIFRKESKFPFDRYLVAQISYEQPITERFSTNNGRIIPNNTNFDKRNDTLSRRNSPVDNKFDER